MNEALTPYPSPLMGRGGLNQWFLCDEVKNEKGRAQRLLLGRQRPQAPQSSRQRMSKGRFPQRT